MMNTSRKKDPFRRREPLEFMLWIAVIGISITFVSLTMMHASMRNKYLEAKSENFSMPGIFWLSTVLILISSYTIHKANWAVQKEEFIQYKNYLGFTLLLGIAFITLQVLGWNHLSKIGVILGSTPSAAFVYVISGLHIAHILGGLVFLAIMFIQARKNKTYVDAFVYSVNPPNQMRLKLVTKYWHFVDVLWMYLFLFFIFLHP